MTDNPFLQDVNAVLSKLPSNVDSFKDKLAVLNARGVNSYDSLFSLMRDLDTDTTTLLQAYDVMYLLSSKVDKRRAVSPLMNALKSNDSRIRQQAAWLLGAMRSKRAVPSLIEIAQNQDEDKTMRSLALYALETTQDQRAIPLFRKILLDVDEPVELRANAAEWLCSFDAPQSLNDYIEVLGDESRDVRFWAAFGIYSLRYKMDISPALSAIDPVAAFDHAAPPTALWHVDREAFEVLELIYWGKLAADEKQEPSCWLMSPAPEYDTFLRQYRQRTETGYVNLPTPPVNLKVDPAWLGEQLKSLGAELNVRQPKPQAYLLDWKLKFEEGTLIGGLHRDGYGVVVTGNYAAAHRFAQWYRGIMPTKEPLFLYAWADEGIEIKI